ncbi:MAG: hypothetical protein JXI33_03895 [Candidatus Aminicenantes bacterium]|nr:hypothetical protein [Candidatus Aminicenantes bacterium]
MTLQSKVCQFCKEINPIDARECRSCGRFFIAAAGQRAAFSPADAFRHPAVICTAILIGSLFLPWFSIMVFSMTAVQFISLSRQAGGFSIRAGELFAMTRLLFILLPFGCLLVLVQAFRGASLRLVGTITGAIPAAIFILMFLDTSHVLNVMGIGFIIAILAGMGLILFSYLES